MMHNSVDLYLGAFLILCGFALSLLNLRRFIKNKNSIPAILLSENIFLMCIGIAFINRTTQEMSTFTVQMQDIQGRIANVPIKDEMDCNFYKILNSYGPLIVSLVNSFLSLVIDNFMHYKMLSNANQEDEENTVQEIGIGNRRTITNQMSKLKSFGKRYFSYLVIVLQWIVPILIALSMYPMDVREKRILIDNIQTTDPHCMALVDAKNDTCFLTSTETNYDLEVRNLIPSNYLEAHEDLNRNESVVKEISSVVNNVFEIISNYTKNTAGNVSVTSATLWRKPKSNDKCMKVCYLDNKILTLYMFVIAIVSYFVPITISTIILTKIHIMQLKRPSLKTYVTRELLYSILFWTPVMFDTFINLLLCSYSMSNTRASIFNVIANVYQAVKNFMNTKYFNDNLVNPI